MVAMMVAVTAFASACSSDDSVGGPATFVPGGSTATTAPSTTGGTAPTGTGTDDTDPDDTVGTGTTPSSGASTDTSDAATSTTEGTASTTAGDVTTTTVAVDATSTTTAVTVPTSTVPALPVFDPTCVVEVAAGESLSLIADRFEDETVTVPSLRLENGIAGDEIDPGDYLDVCPANGINDITGEQRTDADAAAAANLAVVTAQQTKLNDLFYGLGTPALLVDGISGPVTRQRLCAARLALGLPVSTTDMVAGSPEEQTLMAATALPLPFTTALSSPRWVLIDQTCQFMFVGEGVTRLVFAFPTSTGQPEFPTRLQDRSRAFRYDPALANGGWHDSTTYPAAEDNPLNGNMYKPIYFDRGQAIHGANNVPTTPQSHGCARLRVEHQELLLGWLGLGDVTQEIGSRERINVTVNVQGVYIPT